LGTHSVSHVLPILTLLISQATIAEKYGRRAVLVTSLLGTSITCVVFGTCTTIQEALCVRLLQGVFGGAVGVARGSVAFVTDPSNEGRAYAILGCV
jgi:MFS family permease